MCVTFGSCFAFCWIVSYKKTILASAVTKPVKQQNEMVWLLYYDFFEKEKWLALL